MFTSSLSVLQRSLVALTALQLGYGPRALVLARHHVTESDLHQFRADWELLQAERSVRTEQPLADRVQELP